jgi:hypothetical protein
MGVTVSSALLLTTLPAAFATRTEIWLALNAYGAARVSAALAAPVTYQLHRPGLRLLRRH